MVVDILFSILILFIGISGSKKGFLDELNDPLSIALTLKSTYSSWKWERDSNFEKESITLNLQNNQISVAIIDYGIGNILSIKKAFEQNEVDINISDKKKGY